MHKQTEEEKRSLWRKHGRTHRKLVGLFLFSFYFAVRAREFEYPETIAPLMPLLGNIALGLTAISALWMFILRYYLIYKSGGGLKALFSTKLVEVTVTYIGEMGYPFLRALGFAIAAALLVELVFWVLP